MDGDSRSRGGDPARDLGIASARCHVLHGIGHIHLLVNADVYARLVPLSIENAESG